MNDTQGTRVVRQTDSGQSDRAHERASGWAAELRCAFAQRDQRTVIDDYRHRGPLVVQRPFYPEGEICHVYLLHPPGGVVSGDSLAVNIVAGAGAKVLITTPGATKFYRSNSAVAQLRHDLRVDDTACLEWLPQENIIFSGARAELRTELRLAGNGRFLGWEILCLGRPASGERFDRGSCETSLGIWRDERPLLLERQHISGGQPVRHAAWGLMGYDVSASFVATHCAPSDLAAARDCGAPEDAFCGLTLVEDVLIARCLARYAEQAKDYFQTLWCVLRRSLFQRDACPPRVWLT